MRPLTSYPKSTVTSVSLPSADRRKYKARKGASAVTNLQPFRKGMSDHTNLAYREAVGKLKSMLNETYVPRHSHHHHHRFGKDESDEEDGISYFSESGRFTKSASSSRRPFSRFLTPKPSPHLSDVPPGANQPDVLNFIERQEDYIEQLENESQYCRDELSQLLGKVKDLIAENEALHSQQKSSTYKSGDMFDKRYDSHLSERTHYRPLPDPSNIVYESRISELEAQLTQMRVDLQKAQEETHVYKTKALDNDPLSSSSEFYKQIESLHREKREMSDSLCKLQSAVAQLREKESDCSRKVLRTQDVAEKAQMDKQQAEMEVHRLKSELDHQHQRLLDVLSEQTRKISEERQQAERRYLQHVEQLSAELTSQRDSATKVQLELERHLRVEDDLRRDLAAKNATADNLRKELTGKIATLQNELSAALSERDVLEQELSSNRMSGERSERVCRQEAARLQVEVNALRQRIEKSEEEITKERRENLSLSEQISILESEITIYKAKLGEIEADGSITKASTVRELEGVVQKQAQSMSTLTKQCQALTLRLEDEATRHKEEMAGLQNSLEYLTSRLETSLSERQWAAQPEPYPQESEEPAHFENAPTEEPYFTEQQQPHYPEPTYQTDVQEEAYPQPRKEDTRTRYQEPREEVQRGYQEPRQVEAMRYEDPRKDEQRMYQEPRSEEPRMYQEPRKEEPRKYQEPRSEEPRKYQEPRSEESRMYQEPQSEEPRMYQEPRTEERVEPKERPVLSRTNSRGSRGSPARKNPLVRRESRMKIERTEYEPPKQQFPRQQPQNAVFFPEDEVIPEQNYPYQAPEVPISSGYAAPRFEPTMQEDMRPDQEPQRYEEPYDYRPEQSDMSYGAAPVRTPSRESLRRPYQEQEAYQPRQPEETRLSSGDEDLQRMQNFEAYQQPAYEEPRSKPPPRQVMSSNESLVEPKQEELRPRQSAVARQAASKLMQKAQRNAPTRLQ